MLIAIFSALYLWCADRFRSAFNAEILIPGRSYLFVFLDAAARADCGKLIVLSAGLDCSPCDLVVVIATHSRSIMTW